MVHSLVITQCYGVQFCAATVLLCTVWCYRSAMVHSLVVTQCYGVQFGDNAVL